MSILLYNPLEAIVLILPLWVLQKDRLEYKNRKTLILNFLKDAYILSTIFFILQIPLKPLEYSLFYSLYNIVVCVIGTIFILNFYNKNRFKISNIVLCYFIEILYFSSLNIIIVMKDFETSISKIRAEFIQQLYGNLYIKTIQFVLCILILGGIIMLKKFLIKTTKKNICNVIASTQNGWGEPKLSEKLKKDIKESK